MNAKKFCFLFTLLFLAIVVFCQQLPSIPANKHYHPQYFLLSDYLKRYQNIKENGGWPSIRFSKNSTTSQNGILRKRLFISGELKNYNEALKDSFDTDLKKALILFQKNHGLEQTAKMDKQTVNELNVPVKSRIKQLEINIARWKNLPPEPGNKIIFVNTAAYNLELIEKDIVVIEMRVVVGRFYRKTPVFTANLSYLEFNPYWFVPPNISRKDILPKIKRNHSFVNANNISVQFNGLKIRSDTINWNNINADNNPYKFVQSPGGTNPMGKVIFAFPNPYNVYMHDTPDKQLFEKPHPSFSSGCIRLSKAIELAKIILKEDKNWGSEKIDSLMNSSKTIRVFLDTPVKVYIQYFTAWVNKDGNLYFAQDIYRRDQ